MATSAPVNITVNPGSGLPYGLTNYSLRPGVLQYAAGLHRAAAGAIVVDGCLHQHPDMDPAASLIPYAPNVQLYSDNAQKVRYFSFPTPARLTRPANKSPTRRPTPGPSLAGTVSSRLLNCSPIRAIPPRCSAWKPACWCGTPTAPSMASPTNGARQQRRRFADQQLTEAIPFQPGSGVYHATCGIIPAPAIVCSATLRWPIMCLGSSARQLNGNLHLSQRRDRQPAARAQPRWDSFIPPSTNRQITNIEQLSA
jgi:hypothetical protein